MIFSGIPLMRLGGAIIPFIFNSNFFLSIFNKTEFSIKCYWSFNIFCIKKWFVTSSVLTLGTTLLDDCTINIGFDFWINSIELISFECSRKVHNLWYRCVHDISGFCILRDKDQVQNIYLCCWFKLHILTIDFSHILYIR